MQRLVVMYPQPDDPAAFMEYYTSKHLPLAGTLPGIVKVSYGQASAVGPGESPYFLIAEIDFEDEAALMNALTSDVGARVAADIPNYSPKGATLLHYTL